MKQTGKKNDSIEIRSAWLKEICSNFGEELKILIQVFANIDIPSQWDAGCSIKSEGGDFLKSALLDWRKDWLEMKSSMLPWHIPCYENGGKPYKGAKLRCLS